MNPGLLFLVIILLVLVWVVLSPLFGKIGSFIVNLFRNMFSSDNDKEEG